MDATDASKYASKQLTQRPKRKESASGSSLMVAHAHIQLPIELLKINFLMYVRGKPCSKFGEDRSISDVTILSTDAGRTDGRTDGHTNDYIVSSAMHCVRQTIIYD